MDSEALLALIDVARFKGRKVLLVRGQSGRELLPEQLTAQGMELETLVAYRRLPPVFDAERAKLLVSLLSEQNDWIITSSESLRFLISFAERLGEDRAFVAKLQSQRLFVPHVRIAETARQLGFSRIELTGSGDQNLMIALSNKV
jgi:uroporphyrinogen-III synthase